MRLDIEAARVGHLRRRQVLGAAAATCLSPLAVHAQPKVLRIVAPFPPGGSTDILARTLADKLAPALGQTVAVENKVGANGAIGTESVVKAVPDGQTLLVTTNAGITINPLLYKKMVNPMEGLAPLVQLVELELVLAVRADSPVRSIKDFVEQAKRQPGGLTFASVGPGSLSHLAGESFAIASGAPLVHVPYKGAAPALTDLLSGQVDAYFGTPPTFVQHVKTGKLRVLATTAALASDAFPGLPRVADTYKGFEVVGWQGLFAPIGTPQSVRDRLAKESIAALADEAVRGKLEDQGMRVTARPAAELADIIRRERDVWARIVERAKISLD
jgi:tripartite-type tricarboxylate transporter receptor subunit TctC